MRKMLEDMGVQVVEVAGLCDAAVYVEDVAVLLIRPAIDQCDLAAAAEAILLDCVPQQRRPLGT